MNSELAKRKVGGGKMSKSRRFGERFVRTDAPGPKYDTQKETQHVPSLLMRQRTSQSLKRSTGEVSANFRGDGRDSFITGSITAKGLAQYKEHSHTFGPTYDPNMLKLSTKPSYGVPAPPKNARFSDAEPHHSCFHLAAVSPGPKYLPKHFNLELTTSKAPTWDLGLKLEKALELRYPPPGRSSNLVGPGTYPTFPKENNESKFLYEVPPQHPFDKAPRMSAKVWISEEHASKMPEFMIKASPGPIYKPTNFDMASEEKVRRRTDAPKPPAEGGAPAFV
jgi:hypothetical protein